MSDDRTKRYEELRQEVTEIAEVLPREKPPGTRLRDVWQEALSLHRVRYETKILPPKHESKENISDCSRPQEQ